jgi:hypothetical protein
LKYANIPLSACALGGVDILSWSWRSLNNEMEGRRSGWEVEIRKEGKKRKRWKKMERSYSLNWLHLQIQL